MSATTSPASFAPSPPTRDGRLTVRLAASELEYLDTCAAEHGLTRSELVRAVFGGRISLVDPPVPSGPMIDVRV